MIELKGSISSKKMSLLSFFTMFVIGTDTFVVAPLLPTLANEFQINLDISGWMVSAYALGYAVFALFTGPFSDKHDRRTILLTGLIGFSITTALCGLSYSFWTMILFRFLSGICAAFVSPQIWASIPILVEKENIVKIMGSASAGLAAAQLAGIPIGSFLADISWHIPFYAISLSTVFLWWLLFRNFPSIPYNSDITDNKSNFLSPYKEVLDNTKLKYFLLAYLIFQTGNFASFSFFGAWLYKDYGLGISSIGIAMIFVGLGFMIGSFFGNIIIKLLGIPRSFFYGFIIFTILYIALPFSPNLYISIFTLSIIMLVAGFMFPLFMTTLQMQATTARGTVSALANTAMYIGTFVGGIVGGVLLNYFIGFFGISLFTVIAYLISMYIYGKAGAFK